MLMRAKTVKTLRHKKQLENLLLHTYKKEAWIEFMLPEPIFDCVPYASVAIKLGNLIHHSRTVNN